MDPFKQLDRVFLLANKQWRSSFRSVHWDNLKSIDKFLTETQAIVVKYPKPNENIKNCIEKCFDVVLQKYPLFFGYWKTYSRLVSVLYEDDSSKATEVLRRSVTKFPRSFELWMDYLKAIVSEKHTNEKVLSEYETAASLVGNQFMSGPFWDSYIAFVENETTILNEKEKILHRIYESVTSVPMYAYSKFYKQYKMFISEHAGLNIDVSEVDARFKKISTTVNAVWAFESKMKQTYFTLNPVPQPILNNWENYISFLNAAATDTLYISTAYAQCCFERCLVPCYKYEYFWLRYYEWSLAKFGSHGPEALEILKRAAKAVPRSATINQLILAFYKTRLTSDSPDHIEQYLSHISNVLQKQPKNRLLFKEYVLYFQVLKLKSRTLTDQIKFFETTIQAYLFSTNTAQSENLAFRGSLINDSNVDILILELIRKHRSAAGTESQTRKYFNMFSNRKQARLSKEFWLEFYSFEKSCKNMNGLVSFVNNLGSKIVVPTSTMNTILLDFQEFFQNNYTDTDYAEMNLANAIDPLVQLDMKLNDPRFLAQSGKSKSKKEHQKLAKYKEVGHPGLVSDRPILTNSIVCKNTKKRKRQGFDLPKLKNLNKLNSLPNPNMFPSKYKK